MSEAPAEVRIARLFDGFDERTGPYFAPERFAIDDPDERARIADYLRGGTILVRSTALDPDMVDPSRGTAVPASFRTDGAWIWSDGLMYYVEHHGVAPPAEFVARIVAHGYRCAEPDPAALRRASERLARARAG